MSDLAAFVIAGGQSSRMGRDKAFLSLDGRTLLERALAVARSVSGDVSIVGPRERFATTAELRNCRTAELKIIEDIYPGQGPLAGIHAALKASQSELNLMIGVDTPFLDPRFVAYLVEQARTSGATVTVPVTSAGIPHPTSAGIPHPVSPKSGETRVGQPPDQHGSSRIHSDPRSSAFSSGSGQPQPLCAVYRREFAAVAENALRQRRNNIVPLFAQVATRAIAEDEMRRLAFDPRMFDNLNTPEEWDQACRRSQK